MKKPKIKKKVKEDRPCKLCGKVTELKESHIIPKFVYNWIKNTSATGRFRSMGSPNIPRQDGFKLNLLCSACENIFSKYEAWFSVNFFYKSTKELKVTYEYDQRLFKFFASIFWRTLIINIDREVYLESSCRKEMMSCEEALRNFLLSDSYPVDFDNFYIGAPSYLVDGQEDLKKLNYFFTRTADMQIIFDTVDDVMFFYCLIPFFMFIGNIKGLNPDDFVNSKINPDGGVLKTYEMVNKDRHSTSFLRSSIKRTMEFDIPESQKRNIEQMIMKDTDKAINSGSFLAMHLDRIRDRET